MEYKFVWKNAGYRGLYNPKTDYIELNLKHIHYDNVVEVIVHEHIHRILKDWLPRGKWKTVLHQERMIAAMGYSTNNAEIEPKWLLRLVEIEEECERIRLQGIKPRLDIKDEVG